MTLEATDASCLASIISVTLKACDCWSIGVIAYMLLAGMPPFMAPSDDGVKLKIRWARVRLRAERAKNSSRPKQTVVFFSPLPSPSLDSSTKDS